MHLFNAAGLGFAVIIPIIIIMYLIKPRRREMMISSTFLWEQVLKDIEASNPWQRLRKNLLLMLQLLAAVLLVLALGRPYIPAAGDEARHLLVVLDCSASMAASDLRPSRFEVARRQVDRLINELGPDDRMTLIAMGDSARIMASASQDRRQLRSALQKISLSSGSAALEPVLSIASSLSHNSSDLTMYILTDGNVVPVEGEIRLSCPVKVQRIGSYSDNLAISTLATRRDASRILTLARVNNFSDKKVETQIELRADDLLVDVRQLTLEPGEAADLIWEDLPKGTNIIDARLTREDIYSADNRAWAVVDRVEKYRALLVSPGNVFMEKSLALVNGLEIFKTGPDNYEPTDDTYELYVFDGYLPESLPPAAMIVLNPPEKNSLIQVQGIIKNMKSLSQPADEPLLKYVETDAWQIATACRIVAPPWSRTLLEYQQKPMLIAGEYDNRRLAIFAFDLHDSNIPLQTGFPILINNLTGWLLQEGDNKAFQSIRSDYYTFSPLPGSDKILLKRPNGDEKTYQAPFPPKFKLDIPGVYSFSQQVGDRNTLTYLVKNCGDIVESDLNPRDLNTAAWSSQTHGVSSLSNRQLWPGLAWGVLILLLLEWEVYRRGY